MPKQSSKQPRKIKVLPNTPMVLVSINNMLRTRRQELQALVEAGQAYAKSVRLDPAKDYRFAVEGENVYAFEVTAAMREQQVAQMAVQGKAAETKE